MANFLYFMSSLLSFAIAYYLLYPLYSLAQEFPSGLSSIYSYLYTAHQRGKRETGQPVSVVARPGKAIWLHSTQAGVYHSDQTACPQQNQRSHHWLLQQLQHEVLFRRNDIKLAQGGEWHHLCDTVLPCSISLLNRSAEGPEPIVLNGSHPSGHSWVTSVTTESVLGCRWILQELEKVVEWAQMRFNQPN